MPAPVMIYPFISNAPKTPAVETYLISNPSTLANICSPCGNKSSANDEDATSSDREGSEVPNSTDQNPTDNDKQNIAEQ